MSDRVHDNRCRADGNDAAPRDQVKRNRRQRLELMRRPPDLLHHVLLKICSLLRRPIWRGQFKAFKLERRRNDTAHERPSTQTRCRLPGMGRHDALKRFAVACGGAEPDGVSVSIHPMHLKAKRRAGEPDPDFHGIDAMPVGAFACREKEQNRACSPSAAVGKCIPPHLAIVAAFRMRLKVECGTHLPRC